MMSRRKIDKPRLMLVIVTFTLVNALASALALWGRTKIASFVSQQPCMSKSVLDTGDGAISLSRFQGPPDEVFPVCVLLSIGDDTSDARATALPFSLLYRLFEPAQKEILAVGQRVNTKGSASPNETMRNPPVKVLVGVDFPSVACHMANDSLHLDFMDAHPDVAVDLTCGTPSSVLGNLTGSDAKTDCNVRCGTVIVGRSSKYVSQISAAWMSFLSWESFQIVDLDGPDPSRSAPVLPREQWRPTLVTAFSSNHIAVSLLLLRSMGKAGQVLKEAGSFDVSIVVYKLEPFDTTMSKVIDCVVNELNEKFKVPTEVRLFDYSKHPSWMRINQSLGEYGKGEYAWKAIIIHEVLVERGLVIWTDGGARYDNASLLESLSATLEQGFTSQVSCGDIGFKLHPGAIKYFRYQIDTVDAHRNCDGSRIGATLNSYDSIVRPWFDCSCTRQCIAPTGSSRDNHRQDQSALTILADLANKPCQGISSNVGYHLDEYPDDIHGTDPTSCYQDPLKFSPES